MSPDTESPEVEPEVESPEIESPEVERRDRHLGPVIALGLAAAIAIAAVVVSLVAGDDFSPTAIRVDSDEISQKTFNDALSDLGSSLADQQSGADAQLAVTDAFLPSTATAQLATLYVNTQLLGDALARRGIEVSAQDRRDFIDANRDELSVYSAGTRDLLVDNNLFQSALVGSLGQDQAVTAFRRLVRRSDVHVDPRYGFWNPTRAEVCPPAGCPAPAPSGG